MKTLPHWLLWALLAQACGPQVIAFDAHAQSDAAGRDTEHVDVAVSDSDAPIRDALAPDASPCADRDGDGHADRACGGDDCDDEDPRVHPGQQPQCDWATDSNCNGTRDDDEPAARNGRCAQEGIDMGLPQQSMFFCATLGRDRACAACMGIGSAARCVCWTNGSHGHQECRPTY